MKICHWEGHGLCRLGGTKDCWEIGVLLEDCRLDPSR